MGVTVEREIVMKRINEIRPYARNPRRNEKTIELLCNLIPKVGFNVPIVIDEHGIIVKGHARFAAAIRLGMKEVPCIVSHADEESIKADRILDNKISEYSEWINDEVLQEIESIDTDIDFSGLGFPTVKFDGMPEPQIEGKTPFIESKEGTGEIPERPKMAKKYYKCVCPDCGHVMFVEADKLGG